MPTLGSTLPLRNQIEVQMTVQKPPADRVAVFSVVLSLLVHLA